MIDFLAYNAFLCSVCSLILIAYVVVKYYHFELGKVSILLSASFGLWSVGFWLWFYSTDYHSAILCVRILSIGASIIPVAFLHWVLVFLGIKIRYIKILFFSYLITAFFVLFSFSDFFVRTVERVGGFDFWPRPGFIYHFYVVFSYFGMIGFGIYLLLVYYFKEAGMMRVRFFYIILAMTLCALGGATNFFGWYGIAIPPYGNFIVTIFTFVCIYSISNHKAHISNMRLLKQI